MRPGQALSVSDMYVMFDNVQNRLMETKKGVFGQAFFMEKAVESAFSIQSQTLLSLHVCIIC